MPIFDFSCNHCGQKFERMISNSDKKNVTCPECNSGEVKQLLSLFNTGSSGTKNPLPCQATCPKAG